MSQFRSDRQWWLTIISRCSSRWWDTRIQTDKHSQVDEIEPLLLLRWWSLFSTLWTILKGKRQISPTHLQGLLVKSILWLKLRTQIKLSSLTLLRSWMKNGSMIPSSEGEDHRRTCAETFVRHLSGMLLTTMRWGKLKRRVLIKLPKFKWKEAQQNGRLCIETSSENSLSLLVAKETKVMRLKVKI